MALTEELLRLCARHAGAKHFYLGDQMPPQKKQNAYEGLQIPGEETLIAFVDSTLLGDCKTGLAITASGVYFNNSGLAQSKSMHLTWDELATQELTPIRMGAIDFGGNTLFELAGSQFKRNDLLELLLEAQKAAGQNAKPSGFSGAGYQPQMEEKLQGSSARMDFSGVEPCNWVTPPPEPNRPSPYFESPRERVHTGLYGETQARSASQHLLENAPSSSSPQGMPGRTEPRGGSTFLGGSVFNRSPYEREGAPYQNGRMPMGEPTYRPPTGPLTHNPTPARMQEPLHHDDDVHPPHTVNRDEPGQVTRRPAGRQVDADE